MSLLLLRRHTTSGLASGGVLARGTLYRHFESSAPVPTFAKPRPTAKPPGVSGNAGATQQLDNEERNRKYKQKNIGKI